uniref:Taste receptor type 2 n=1 Tax=Geotrypetes seraphini TaxID=260995 RepID=A0A6P8SF12_GEOSA
IFIVVVNSIDWVTTRHLNTIDIILISLGIARFLFQSVVMLHWIILIVYPNFYIFAEFLNVLYSFWTFVDQINVWFAGLLGVYYCVKVAKYSHPAFVFLKLKILQIVPWLLLGCILASVVTSTSITWTYKDPPNIASQEVLEKCTMSTFLMVLLCLGYSLPFFIICVALLLLIRSLLGHIWHMNENTCNPRPDVYFTAIKAMVSFLLGLTGLHSSGEPLLWIISIFYTAYPSIHSVILILSNSELRQVLERIFRHAKVHLGGDIT